jgi:glycosyltransferase involved in cell wall biosynthesis
MEQISKLVPPSGVRGLKLTLVIAAYNSAKTLRKTLDSFVEQVYLEKECVVVDGNSKDETVEILTSYGDKIRWISEPDKGIYDAINKGIAISTGDALCIIGTDDFLPHPKTFNIIADAFQKFGTDAIYGDTFRVYAETMKLERYWKGEAYKRTKFENGWMPPHPGFYLKKSAYNNFGLYRNEFKIGGDYELMLRMLYKNNVSAAYIDEVLCVVTAGGASGHNYKLRSNEDKRAWQVNDLKPKFYTVFIKPFTKLGQFLYHRGMTIADVQKRGENYGLLID